MIGDESIVAAMSFRQSRIYWRRTTVLVGTPARVMREVSEQTALEAAEYSEGISGSRRTRCRASLRETSPLTAVEANRPSA